MGRISLLDKEVSELIAAGEVVERPMSIVKELVENSIDAGSSRIEITIENGGIDLISICDDGNGIANDQLELAFERHSTSKIKCKDDIEKISTLGFRGEALASISAVANVSLISKTKDDQNAKEIIVRGGVVNSVKETAISKGTIITVTELFYNLPARLKFLKSERTETGAIVGLIEKLALANPSISFIVKNGKTNKKLLSTLGTGDMLITIRDIYGKQFKETMIPIEHEQDGIKIEGYISDVKMLRNNRTTQNTFINSRFVRSRVVVMSLEEAYKSVTMKGKYPACVLNIQIDYDKVDVNVHPAKTEIRFTNERAVYGAIYNGVKSTLDSNDNLTETIKQTFGGTDVTSKYVNTTQEHMSWIDNEQKNENNNKSLQLNQNVDYSRYVDEVVKIQQNNEFKKLYQNTNSTPVKTDEDILQSRASFNKQNSQKYQFINIEREEDEEEDFIVQKPMPKSVIEHNTSSLDIEKADNNEHSNDYNSVLDEPVTQPPPVQMEQIEFVEGGVGTKIKFIGEAFMTYVIFEMADNIIMIDKHAAHEKIIYDKLISSTNLESRQMLLSPLVVQLDSAQYGAVFDNIELVQKLGFDFDEFEGNTVIIREVAMTLVDYDCADIFCDIATKISQNMKDIKPDIFEHLLHSIACRTAIKANDKVSEQELTALVEEVLSNPSIRNCPHGRPVSFILSKKQVEKNFKRLV